MNMNNVHCKSWNLDMWKNEGRIIISRNEDVHERFLPNKVVKKELNCLVINMFHIRYTLLVYLFSWYQNIDTK